MDNLWDTFYCNDWNTLNKGWESVLFICIFKMRYQAQNSIKIFFSDARENQIGTNSSSITNNYNTSDFKQ